MSKCPLTGKSCASKREFAIYEVVEGKPKKMMLCGDCATKYFQDNRTTSEITKRIAVKPKRQGKNMKLLTEFMDCLSQKRCPYCKTTLKDMKVKKKLGCYKCYDFFEKELSGKPPEDKVIYKAIVDKFDEYEANTRKKLNNLLKKEKYEDVKKLENIIKEVNILKCENTKLEQNLIENLLAGQFDAAKRLRESISRRIENFMEKNAKK